MPNNGIISRYANVPDQFKVNTTTEFNNETDMVVVNKTLEGSKVEQKAVTLNQLAGMVGGGSQGPQGIQGPQGPAGPAVPSGLSWKGYYEPETNYALNDVVTWVNPDTDILGSYWVTDEAGVYNVNPTDGSGNINEGWAFLASQGAQGIQGPAGPQGEVGPQGPAGTATFPYKEFIGRAVFGPGLGGYLFQGYTTLNAGISASRESAGVYTYTFINTSDFNGILSKYTFDLNIRSNSGTIYHVLHYNGSNSISVSIYTVNPDTGEYLLADPVGDQATLYYRKYN